MCLTTASEPTSALLHANSSLSVGLRTSQAFRLVCFRPPLHSARSLLPSLLSCAAQPVVCTCQFPGGFDLSHLSFPSVGPAMVVCCIVLSRLVFTGRFLVLAVLLCSLGRFPDLSPFAAVSVHHATWWTCPKLRAVRALDPLFLVFGMYWARHLANHSLFLFFCISRWAVRSNSSHWSVCAIIPREFSVNWYAVSCEVMSLSQAFVG